MASIDWAKATAIRDENHLSFGIWCDFTVFKITASCNWGQGVSVVVHDDVMKWKHFPRYSPFVRGTHRSPVNYPNKGQWRQAVMFSLICAWINGWVNNREAGDKRRHRTHYDFTVMQRLKPALLSTYSLHQRLRPGAPCPDMVWL